MWSHVNPQKVDKTTTEKLFVLKNLEHIHENLCKVLEEGLKGDFRVFILEYFQGDYFLKLKNNSVNIGIMISSRLE